MSIWDKQASVPLFPLGRDRAASGGSAISQLSQGMLLQHPNQSHPLPWQTQPSQAPEPKSVQEPRAAARAPSPSQNLPGEQVSIIPSTLPLNVNCCSSEAPGALPPRISWGLRAVFPRLIKAWIQDFCQCLAKVYGGP